MNPTESLKESVERISIIRKHAQTILNEMLEARLKKNQETYSPKKPVVKKIESNTDKFPLFPPPPPPPIEAKTELNEIDDNLPLPPPPPPSSILTPPLSSDENDFILPQKSINNYNENKNKVNYRNKKNLANGGGKIDNQSRDDNNNKNKNDSLSNKNELTSHARDRRSYIETNNNDFNVNACETSKIANGLENGQHPVCDKCKSKITR